MRRAEGAEEHRGAGDPGCPVGGRMLSGRRPAHLGARLGDSLAVELPALTRAALVRIQVPQPLRRSHPPGRVMRPDAGWSVRRVVPPRHPLRSRTPPKPRPEGQPPWPPSCVQTPLPSEGTRRRGGRPSNRSRPERQRESSPQQPANVSAAIAGSSNAHSPGSIASGVSPSATNDASTSIARSPASPAPSSPSGRWREGFERDSKRWRREGDVRLVGL